MKQFFVLLFGLVSFLIPVSVYADAVTPTFLFHGAEQDFETEEGESMFVAVSFSGEVYATRLYLCLQSAEVCDGTSYSKRFDINATTTAFSREWNSYGSVDGGADPGVYRASVRYYEYGVSPEVVATTSSHTITITADSAPSIESVVHGELTIAPGDSVYRSDFTSTASYWTFNFYWPNYVTNSRALFAVLYTPEGESGYTTSSLTNQSFSSQDNNVVKTMSIAPLGGDSAPSGTYTIYIAEAASDGILSDTLLNFTSGGAEGTPAVASTTMTFTYTAEDQFENLGSMTAVSHGGVTIEPNDVLPFDTAFTSSNYWAFDASWPNVVENANALLLLLKGAPGDLEGEDPENGVNYSYSNQAWSAGDISVLKTFSIPDLASEGAHGTYTAILFEKNKKYTDADGVNDSLEWFFTNGESGRPPLRYRTMEFTLQREILECCSSVVFLPGLKGSVLKIDNDILWPANFGNVLTFSNDILQLAINPTTGESVNPVVVDGVLENFSTVPIYRDFVSFMDTLVANTDDDINLTEWKALPYDWRFSPDKILDDGVITPSGTVDLIEEIKTLASNSPTGQVTIVSHSMGGLLGKEVIKRLEEEGAESLIDSFVMVGTPQLGTPQAIASLLHGKGEHIVGGLMVNASDVRQVAQHMQSSYNLLPSSKYFDVVSDPVISFSESANFTKPWREYWGNQLDAYLDFFSFATGGGVAREKPGVNFLKIPEVLNPTLLTEANSLHNSLDNYDLPDSIRTVQIAGWGVPTTKTIEYKNIHFQPGYKLIPTIEGDKTVHYPSAITSVSDELYFFNLSSYLKQTGNKIQHRDLLSGVPIQSLVTMVIKKDLFSDLNFISLTKPEASEVDEQMIVRSNSPVILGVYDEEGNFTGIDSSQDLESAILFITEDIPGSSFVLAGESQSIFLPAGGVYTFSYQSIGEGETTVEIGTFSNDIETITETFSDILTTTTTSATFTVTLSDETTILVDYDADGDIDETIISDEAFAIQQAQAEEVSAPAVSASSSGGGGGGPLWNVPVPIVATTIAPSTSSPTNSNSSSDTNILTIEAPAVEEVVTDNFVQETQNQPTVQREDIEPEVVAVDVIEETSKENARITTQNQTATAIQSGWYDLFIKIITYIVSILNSIASFIKSLF